MIAVGIYVFLLLVIAYLISVVLRLHSDKTKLIQKHIEMTNDYEYRLKHNGCPSRPDSTPGSMQTHG